jgi:YHS domain-containing protein
LDFTSNLSARFLNPLSEERHPVPIDPVCKMHIEIADAAASYDYHAMPVYFCSVECVKAFEKDPDKYMRNMSDEEQTAA